MCRLILASFVSFPASRLFRSSLLEAVSYTVALKGYLGDQVYPVKPQKPFVPCKSNPVLLQNQSFPVAPSTSRMSYMVQLNCENLAAFLNSTSSCHSCLLFFFGFVAAPM